MRAFGNWGGNCGGWFIKLLLVNWFYAGSNIGTGGTYLAGWYDYYCLLLIKLGLFLIANF
jgi:hypothetical protein